MLMQKEFRILGNRDGKQTYVYLRNPMLMNKTLEFEFRFAGDETWSQNAFYVPESKCIKVRDSSEVFPIGKDLDAKMKRLHCHLTSVFLLKRETARTPGYLNANISAAS